jgi:hypothetical protein
MNLPAHTGEILKGILFTQNIKEKSHVNNK